MPTSRLPSAGFSITIRVSVTADTSAIGRLTTKAALFKRFGGVDAWPVVLDTQDTDEIVRIMQAIAPAYGGINLEDIAAPRCLARGTSAVSDPPDADVFRG